MQKPILVVMAAGMGSRYGGLKQIDPVGANGEVILDYSLYDARRAGFDRVIFVIRHKIEDIFKDRIGNHIADFMNVEYAYQELSDLPEGYTVPEGREKPWGTCHAILAARGLIDAPFAVINADDYYGPNGFRLIHDFLTSHTDEEKYRCCMVGYLLKNTVTPNGTVSRGICTADNEHRLIKVVERTKIGESPCGIRYTEDDGATWIKIDGDSLVSMNFWGFPESFLKEAWAHFPAFLDETLAKDPLKGEYFLPSVVSQMLEEGRATVEILPCPDKWYGVTYREDKPEIIQALAKMTESGIYPSPLWGRKYV